MDNETCARLDPILQEIVKRTRYNMGPTAFTEANLNEIMSPDSVEAHGGLGNLAKELDRCAEIENLYVFAYPLVLREETWHHLFKRNEPAIVARQLPR